MTLRAGAVAVRELPESLTGLQGRSFFSGLEEDVIGGNSCIVLDCSEVLQVDRPAIYLLLCCLEEALKHDGDVKLASVPSGTKAILELTGAARVFESFDTKTEAIMSFRRLAPVATFNLNMPGSPGRASEIAA